MEETKLLSFVLPSRNNLEYLKIAYSSIRDNSVKKHWICFADDCSNDGTKQWLKQIKQKDDRVRYIVNESRDRIGHTYLYDKIIDELVETDIFVIWHADMYMLPGADEELMKATENKIISLTRVEPPLHPYGPEKMQMNFGVDDKSFNEDRLLNWYNNKEKNNEYTDGIFAPWACYKSTFQNIGGHDWLFIPQSKEDSDIFNRFKLIGVEFKQTWNGHCYHFTSRGSRFNSHLTIIGKNSSEWEKQNRKSARNFIRKWGRMVLHDNFLNPVITHKRDIGIIIEKPNLNIIGELEPYCNNIILSETSEPFIRAYLEFEQGNTLLDLSKKFEKEKLDNDIIVTFRGEKAEQLKEIVSFITNIDYYIQGKDEFKFSTFTVRKLRDRYYEEKNIYLNNKEKYNNKYTNLKMSIYK